jgi:hypothetical protein
MAQYEYHTEAMIKYMENNLQEFHYHKDVFSQFHTGKSTKQVLKAFSKLCTLNKHDKGEGDSGWNNLSVAANGHHINEDETLIKSEIGQYHVDKSDLIFVKMYRHNH